MSETLPAAILDLMRANLAEAELPPLDPEPWVEAAERLIPGGIVRLHDFVRLTAAAPVYDELRDKCPALWREERRAVAAQIRRALIEEAPSHLWAGLLLLLDFRNMVARRVIFRATPEPANGTPPSAFVYSMM